MELVRLFVETEISPEGLSFLLTHKLLGETAVFSLSSVQPQLNSLLKKFMSPTTSKNNNISRSLNTNHDVINNYIHSTCFIGRTKLFCINFSLTFDPLKNRSRILIIL